MNTQDEIKEIHLVDASGKIHVINKFNEDAGWVVNPAYFKTTYVRAFAFHPNGTLTPVIVRNSEFLKNGGETMCLYTEWPMRYDEQMNSVPPFTTKHDEI